MKNNVVRWFYILVLAAMLVIPNLMTASADGGGGFDPTPTPTATSSTNAHDPGWGG